MLAGVQDVLAPGNKRTGDAWVSKHLPAAVAAIFSVCMFVVDKVTMGAARHAKEEMAQRTIEIMRQARNELDVKGLSDEEFWAGWTPLSRGDVTEGMRRMEDEWSRGGWFAALLEAAEDERDAAAEAAKAKPIQGQSGIQDVKAQMRKADTMHLDKFNFLSREKREAFETWK